MFNCCVHIVLNDPISSKLNSMYVQLHNKNISILAFRIYVYFNNGVGYCFLLISKTSKGRFGLHHLCKKIHNL